MLDVVAVKNKGLEVDILIGSLNLVDQVTRVVNVLKVGRRFEIKSLPYLIPRSVQLDHMLQVREVFQVNQFVVRDINHLQVFVLIDTLSIGLYLSFHLPR